MADLARPKFILDPIHGLIRIEQDYMLRLLDTPAVQRLRRIRQLGMAGLVYPGAEHSRLTHSLGVHHLASRVLQQLDPDGTRFDDTQRAGVLTAALLHDVGHGPFSHVFERIYEQMPGAQNVGHEDWSRRIVQDDEAVHRTLSDVSPDLPDLVCRIVDKSYRPHYVTAIISSQLDVDRFDYLLRDSHMTGVKYGEFDLEWMLRTLTIRTVEVLTFSGVRTYDTIVIDGRRGLSGLEMQLIGRHNMYRHVYFHKTVRSAEVMLMVLLLRAAELLQAGAPLTCNAAFRRMAMGEQLSVADYLTLDDFAVWSWLQAWRGEPQDRILNEFAARLVDRRLFKGIPVPGREAVERRMLWASNGEIVADLVRKAGYDPRYYMLRDDAADVAYKNYVFAADGKRDPVGDDIWYVDHDNSVKRLSWKEDSIVNAARDALSYREAWWFVPEDVAAAARTALSWT
ncbi:MAG TPA: HD domain-containing protein [Chloroflexota bacterium]|nr:HD domain-containing protein [Chloroflexota bacterium]